MNFKFNGKKYRIREKSIAYYVINAVPLLFLFGMMGVFTYMVYTTYPY